jgi:two-component system, cell cycle sensor histidine kinase and response regulator CckA
MLAEKPMDPRPLVLVVDDEPLLHVIASRILERAGFEVLHAQDGLEAIELMGLTAASPTLLVTDIRMPRMTGIELGRWVSSRYPAVPILYVSGFTDEFPTLDDDGPSRAILAKPFTPDMLLEQVRLLCGPARVRPPAPPG